MVVVGVGHCIFISCLDNCGLVVVGVWIVVTVVVGVLMFVSLSERVVMIVVDGGCWGCATGCGCAARGDTSQHQPHHHHHTSTPNSITGVQTRCRHIECCHFKEVAIIRHGQVVFARP